MMTNTPRLLNKYLGILVRVPDDAGIKITSIEKIHHEEGIFLMPNIKIDMKRIVKAKSK